MPGRERCVQWAERWQRSTVSVIRLPNCKGGGGAHSHVLHTAPCEGPDAFTHRAQAFTGSAGQRSREDIRRDEYTAAGVDHRRLRPKDVKFSTGRATQLNTLQNVSADRRVAHARMRCEHRPCSRNLAQERSNRHIQQRTRRSSRHKDRSMGMRWSVLHFDINLA